MRRTRWFGFKVAGLQLRDLQVDLKPWIWFTVPSPGTFTLNKCSRDLLFTRLSIDKLKWSPKLRDSTHSFRATYASEHFLPALLLWSVRFLPKVRIPPGSLRSQHHSDSPLKPRVVRASSTASISNPSPSHKEIAMPVSWSDGGAAEKYFIRKVP